jgi:hypothetical protein
MDQQSDGRADTAGLGRRGETSYDDPREEKMHYCVPNDEQVKPGQSASESCPSDVG